jgi:outer membrane protein OmpA-like peptidoglycan-associated protein
MVIELGKGSSGIPDESDSSHGRITVTEGEKGLILTLEDVRFKPDSADFLANESTRLDRIARALKSTGTHQLLVEGHTADVGRPEDERALSERRAKRTVDELVARGIMCGVLYIGDSDHRPLVPYTNEETVHETVCGNNHT